ncbi:hypothetical protein MEPL4_4c00330 [Melissococcus plutonius]|uniref:hypothetical protein n=1 Tax=Melissococcus plutonius TaxID=33970 RepID=UPI00065E3809|nr:hypothetical protein [Melissococcus plutonius]AIM25760.1 hypothetical protein MEPL_c010130 [Melissococcus plutonius S1]KMT23444.1 hypothetical protein MEPL2_43p00260 [Melissococcus plutonius]KMT25202.1 hypothetical protein MEPL2_2c07600 [Melissococcus plutonius]KMT26108.1 hypothetical protein MEPL3_3c00330 [Melissococcus plutonius]KMT26838.1 hypothetical protein MEPL1_4c00330 [Melissococcus plutonius]
MIVSDTKKILDSAELNNFGLAKEDIFAYRLPLNYKADRTFLLITEIYSTRGQAGSNRTNAKIEEVELTIVYDDDTQPEQLDDKINELLENNQYEQLSGYHQYDTEVDNLRAVFKYQHTKYLNLEKDDE